MCWPSRVSDNSEPSKILQMRQISGSAAEMTDLLKYTFSKQLYHLKLHS